MKNSGLKHFLLKTVGIFFECLPDDPKLCKDPKILKQNAARLKFYERYGARPIINTLYETPVGTNTDNPPYLVYDPLGEEKKLSRYEAKKIVRAILERKYKHLCSPVYIDMVINSFKDDYVTLRKPEYVKKEVSSRLTLSIPEHKKILLVINDRHDIHHVRTRGYVEAPVRIKTILKELDKSDLFEKKNPGKFSEKHITGVHNKNFFNYFRKVCENIKEGQSIYPYVFPLRNNSHPPKELSVRAGYYCIDTFTPLNKNAYIAAKKAVDCGLTCAKSILEGKRLAYALVRPPGHHAEKSVFGGFCYFNTTAITAQFLSSYGKVAILDIDYHHGNGQQDIFYDRSDVLTVSIHGTPRHTYPYFSGFENEKGEGNGEGYNLNIPLPENINGEKYRIALKRGIKRISSYKPDFLVIALGLDTAKGDPTGTWNLKAGDFELNGNLIGSLGFPAIVIQEGGYNNRVLGTNARSFFTGLWKKTYYL